MCFQLQPFMGLTSIIMEPHFSSELCYHAEHWSSVCTPFSVLCLVLFKALAQCVWKSTALKLP